MAGELVRPLEFEYVGGALYPRYLWVLGERYELLERPMGNYTGYYGSHAEYDLTFRMRQCPERITPMRQRRTALSLGLRRPE